MTDELADLYVHTVTVETYLGTSGYGADLFAAPVILFGGCLVESARRLVRDKDGNEVISETTLYTSPASLALFAPDSRVTTIDGAQSRVIRAALADSGPLALPDHVSVTLT
jgi:hypothetical protein